VAVAVTQLGGQSAEPYVYAHAALAANIRICRTGSAPGQAALHRVDGRHRAATIDGITLSDGEGREERSPSRRSGATSCRLMWLIAAR
jgi:hypothetical protein